jgi:hypothetical protein
MRNSLVGLLLSVATLPLGACRDDGFDTPARYVLSTIDGNPLPATESDGEGFRVTVLADTMVFNSRSRGLSIRKGRFTRPGEDEPESADWTATFEYRVDDGKVSITFDCPPGASCIEGPHLRGTVLPGALRLVDRYRPIALHYERH